MPRRLSDWVERACRRSATGLCLTGPRVAFVEHTTRCNLKCKTCARSYWGGQFTDMESAIVDRVCREIVPRIEHLILSGYGEPLLGPHFTTLFDEAVGRGKSIGFITNGVLLDASTIDRVCRPRVDLNISIDGATNETLRAIRGVSFDMLRRRLESIQQTRRAKNPEGFHLTVIFVLLECNIHELPDLIAILDDCGADKLIVQHPTFGDRKDAFARQALRHHPQLARRILPRIREAAAQARLAVELPSFSFLEQPDAAVASATAPLAPCILPWREVYIDVHGNVKACCFGPAEALGNLARQSFRSIWNGPGFRRLRRTVNSPSPPPYCLRCGLIAGRNRGDESAAGAHESAPIAGPSREDSDN